MGRVLVVDDDESCRVLMRNLLALDGHEVFTAGNGLEAQKVIRAGPEGKGPFKPDLVTVDFEMSQMGGYELVRWLRRHETTREVPIIMISGTDKDIQDVVEMEDVKFLSKMSLNDEILGAVRERLAPAAGNGGSAEALPRLPGKSKPKGQAASAAPAAPAAPVKAQLDLDDNLRKLMSQSKGLASLIQVSEDAATSAKDAAAAAQGGESAPIIQLVDGILIDAINRGASDVHIEAQKDGLMVRLRVDGVLQPSLKLPAALKANIAARIKIMASLNIAEKRLPQDGRFALRLTEGTVVEFRTSTLPAQHGEKIVLRVLRSGKLSTSLSQIFDRPRDLERVEESLKSPTGLILVTGPTGSGKTTTLYSMLETLNSPGKNIITVEDPVEYEIQGITQVPVRANIGLDFERVLRACLRQDPNVILVGEIRDAETAEIALKAAMTGHLVLSTIHTNYAPLAPYRLVNMGVKPFLIVAAMRLVIAQRLMRLLCPHCKEKVQPKPEELKPLSDAERALLRETYAAKGCAKCKGIGYAGRKPIIEVMPTDGFKMRQMILDCANPDAISEQAEKDGMLSLRRGALELVAKGLTSLSEAMTVYYID